MQGLLCEVKYSGCLTSWRCSIFNRSAHSAGPGEENMEMGKGKREQGRGMEEGTEQSEERRWKRALKIIKESFDTERFL